MGKWKNVTEYFSEERRWFRGTYLEIDEVYDECLEVSYFYSEKQGESHIYFGFNRFIGVVYIENNQAEEIREDIKNRLLNEYLQYKDPRDEFIEEFCNHYEVCLPF